MKLTMQFFLKSETYDESVFAWFLGGQVLNVSRGRIYYPIAVACLFIAPFIRGTASFLLQVRPAPCEISIMSQVTYRQGR